MLKSLTLTSTKSCLIIQPVQISGTCHKLLVRAPDCGIFIILSITHYQAAGSISY